MPREQSVLENQVQAVGEDADEADHEQPGPGTQNIERLLSLDPSSALRETLSSKRRALNSTSHQLTR
jgi:hypothetical protein